MDQIQSGLIVVDIEDTQSNLYFQSLKTLMDAHRLSFTPGEREKISHQVQLENYSFNYENIRHTG